MKKRIVIANWKMNPSTLVEARRLFSAIARRTARIRTAKIIICPPILYLADLVNGYRGTTIMFGAQDISAELKEGSFTGEISGTMLKRLGVSYVIVGHSERRARGETDELVARKVRSAFLSGMIPIVCVGETARDEDGRYLQWLERQINDSLEGITRQKAAKLILAYEPIWAIGKTALHAVSPENLHEMMLFIKKVLVKRYGRKVGSSIRILYGGSVEPANDNILMSEGGVDGFLVGHASLNSNDFIATLR